MLKSVSMVGGEMQYALGTEAEVTVRLPLGLCWQGIIRYPGFRPYSERFP